jgi:hypothetical protein
MMSPGLIDMYGQEIQRDHRAEATGEARARRLAPGPVDRLLAALRPRRADRAPAPRPLPTPTPRAAR